MATLVRNVVIRNITGLRLEMFANANCYHQTYLLAGTIFQDSKLSFYQILLGIFLFVTNQRVVNGSTLAIHMGVNVNTARFFLRKLRSACQTSNDLVILKNMISVKDVPSPKKY